MDADNIPEDILTAASVIAKELPARIHAYNREFAARVIARAIMAERDRCIDLVATAFGRVVRGGGEN